MKLGRIEHRKLRRRHSEAVILFAVGPHNFAIAAQAVEEIRNAEGLRGFAHHLPGLQKVTGVLVREAKNYFVVDAAVHLRMLAARATRLLLLRSLPLALSASRIDRMAEISTLHPLPLAFRGQERAWYRGLALLGEDVVPVIEPAALLSPAELAALTAALPAPAASAQGKNEQTRRQLAASG